MLKFSEYRVLSAVDNRRQSLIDDGYKVLFEHKDAVGYYCKMRHRNGTIVSLNANIGNGTITQTTNGRTTHTEKVCKS